MPSPSILWPFFWWTAPLLAVLLMIVSSIASHTFVRLRNRRLRVLSQELAKAGLPPSSDSFCIGEGKNVLVVDGNRLAITDLKNWRLVQTLSWAEAQALKIYDDGSNLIQFRLAFNGGAQTRKIATSSMAGFGRLFIRFGQSGKPVEYIQS